MPSPLALLGILVFALGLFGSGVSVGYKYRDGQAAKQELAVANAYLEAGRRNAEAESAASLEQQKKLDAQRRAAAEKRHTLAQELLKDEIRNCRISDATFGLLGDAVRRSNAATSGGVDGAGAATAKSAKPPR